MESNDWTKWYNTTGKKILQLVLVAGFIYVFFKYILGLVLPFIIAWGFASLLNPFVTWMNRRLKIPRGLGTLFSMLTILSGIVSGLTFIVRQLWFQIEMITLNFDHYKRQVEIILEGFQNRFDRINDKLPLPLAFNSLDELINELLSIIGSFLNEMVTGVYGIVIKVPNAFFFVIVVLLAIFFMTKDNRMIREFVKAQMPEKIITQCILVQNGLKGALGGYIKTQLILMCFTFSICLAGLIILKQPYALLSAMGIAFLDALPVFGSGAILIPWAVYQLILGHYFVGVGLLTIYGTIVVVRQVTEPKVLSAQIGVYALVTLMAMYIGLRLIGVLGMILGPITMVMIRTLQTIGIIPDFKKPKV